MKSLKPLALDFEGKDIRDLSFLSGYDPKSVTKLNLNSTPISSLAGIEKLTNLQKLDIGGTEVEDISPLLTLAGSLRSLRLTNTAAGDVATLGKLSQLQKLYADNNDTEGKISEVDALAALTQLTILSLTGNKNLKNIAGLSALRLLQELHISGTQVSDLRPVASLEKLEKLYLTDTELTAGDLSPLLELTQLTILVTDSDIKHTAEQILRTIRTATTQHERV